MANRRRELGLLQGFRHVLHLADWHYLASWISLPLARLLGKRCLVWGHGPSKLERGARGWLRNLMVRMAHGSLLYGHRAQEILIRQGFSPERLYVIFNSLDYDRQKRLRESLTPEAIASLKRELSTRHDWPILIATCRLVRNKRIELLIEAAAKLREQASDVNILLVGDGPERQSLEELARQQAVADRVIFHGPCFDEETLARMYGASALCVVPGALGLTAMHSMAYGIPVVTHDRLEKHGPETEAIQSGETGDFFQFGNVESLTRTILEWISQPRRMEEGQAKCSGIIEKRCHARVQRELINEAVMGHPARHIPTHP